MLKIIYTLKGEKTKHVLIINTPDEINKVYSSISRATMLSEKILRDICKGYNANVITLIHHLEDINIICIEVMYIGVSSND